MTAIKFNSHTKGCNNRQATIAAEVEDFVTFPSKFICRSQVLKVLGGAFNGHVNVSAVPCLEWCSFCLTGKLAITLSWNNNISIISNNNNIINNDNSNNNYETTI